MSDSRSNSSSDGAFALWFLIGAGFSFLVNRSIFWALIHGFFGFFYILYLCLGCGGGIDGVQQAVDQLIEPQAVEVQVEPEVEAAVILEE